MKSANGLGGRFLNDAPTKRPRFETKKPVVILIALAIFIVILTLIIAPSQGANKSSTELQEEQLANADPKYQEQLPIQEVGLGSSGRSIFIAFVMLAHVLLANLQLGGSWVAVGAESVYLRNKGKPNGERYQRVAKSLTLFNVIVFSAGATLAIAGVLFFVALFPTFTSYAFHIYWWPLFIEAFTFAFEIFFLYTYWYSWNRIKPIWHQVLGYAFAVTVFVQTLMINTIASGMLTPPSSGIIFDASSGLALMSSSEYFSWWFNATTLQLQFHRLFASISFFGFLLAMLSVLHFNDRKDQASKRYWDWVGSFGLGIGLFGLIFQPMLGMLYMLAIRDNNPTAFSFIMTGPRGWEMLLMVALLSSLILVCIAYFVDRRERILSLAKYVRVRRIFLGSMIIAAILALVLIQPAWMGATFYGPDAWINPLGEMRFKYISLFGLVVIAALMVMIDAIILNNEKGSEWGSLSKASRSSAVLAGLLGMFIVIVMGYVRESARSPWTIFDIIPVPGGQAFPTPIPVAQIFVVWGIILVLTTAIFWFVSKVTAYHPDMAEEM